MTQAVPMSYIPEAASDTNLHPTIEPRAHSLVCTWCQKTAIQPLAESEVVTLQTVPGVPGLQNLTFQEVQETQPAVIQQDPTEDLDYVNKADIKHNHKNSKNRKTGEVPKVETCTS